MTLLEISIRAFFFFLTGKENTITRLQKPNGSISPFLIAELFIDLLLVMG